MTSEDNPTAEASSSALDAVNPHQLFVDYPFSSDQSYQEGLASIHASGRWQGMTEEEREDLLRRLRVFYFNRITGSSLTVEDTLAYEPTCVCDINLPSDAPRSEPRVLTFTELKDLIEQGKTDQIPNNRVIPDGLNDAPPSESITPARKKPWETST